MPPVPPALERLTEPLVVGLLASPERIVQIRQNRLLGLKAQRDDDLYVDRDAVGSSSCGSPHATASCNESQKDKTRNR